MINPFNTQDLIKFKGLLWVVLILALFALFINFSILPFLSDEATRGIVTLEMMISGNFIQPTINGELYYNKLPGFNWVQTLFINMAGSTEEWVFRLPTLVSLMLFGVLIYLFTRKFLKQYAIIAALLFIVSGRILFWDSFMGLIDLTYSMVTFAGFVVLIRCHIKARYKPFFILSYLLAGIGFLMKGMPSIAFQILSILALLIYDKQYRVLFSSMHVMGILVFISIVGGYYLMYETNSSMSDSIFTLVNESNRFQATRSNSMGWWLHVLNFPLSLIKEFAPVTLLSVLFISGEIRRKTLAEPFYRYCLLLFGVNIIIYWLSADMRSRYLFMLMPLITIILVKAYLVTESVHKKAFGIMNRILLVGTVLMGLTHLFYPLWNESADFNYVLPISIGFMLATFVLSIIAYYNPRLTLLSVIGGLLIIRIGFNLFNLPARYLSYPDIEYRKGTMEAARLTLQHPLFIFNKTQLNHDASFYITREREQILKRTHVLSNPGTFYLVDQKNLYIFARNSSKYQIVYSFKIKLNDSRIYLVTQNE